MPFPKEATAPIREQIQDPRLIGKYRRRILSAESLKPTLASKAIGFFATTFSVGIFGYFVFYHDFGMDYHCFTPIRGWAHRKRLEFWTLSSEEEQELREQGKI
ncbi:hypothetical protein K7432_005359 [Basidiobolus ranarum]|uniref:Uncharacterized protein n=1 Tax=Basidiobolus ranarum TaxID=34480 RepID=A0ABR2WWN9_9FUNG